MMAPAKRSGTFVSLDETEDLLIAGGSSVFTCRRLCSCLRASLKIKWLQFVISGCGRVFGNGYLEFNRWGCSHMVQQQSDWAEVGSTYLTVTRASRSVDSTQPACSPRRLLWQIASPTSLCASSMRCCSLPLLWNPRMNHWSFNREWRSESPTSCPQHPPSTLD